MSRGRGDWSGGILIALGSGEARSVSPALGLDPKGLDLTTSVPLRVGEDVALQIRCGGPRRMILETRARVESLGPAERGHAVRLLWLEPGGEDLQAVITLARDLGLAPAGRSSQAPVDETIPVRPGEESDALLLDLQDPAELTQAMHQLLHGALMVATATPPEVNTPLLLRLLLPEGQALWLSGRVVYHGVAPGGRPGVGIALDPLPEALRRELRQLLAPG